VFSLTQIWDQAVSGHCFFEEVIRENIDLGRPEQLQLIFSRKMNKYFQLSRTAPSGNIIA
jgi:hypothetical protein